MECGKDQSLYTCAQNLRFLAPLGLPAAWAKLLARRRLAAPGLPMEATRDGKIVDGQIALSTALWDTSLVMPGRQDAPEVDARDANTPDKWIKRHPDMLRNTGAHPFNSEPPLKNLQAAGWITPPSLHVVRNHGAVPQLSWSEHRLKITGVPKPMELSMEQIASGEWGTIVSIPVTFICAGNRRKEQNLTKKTVGPFTSNRQTAFFF